MLIRIVLITILTINAAYPTYIVRPSISNLKVKEKPSFFSKTILIINPNDVYELSSCDNFGWCKIDNLGFVPKHRLSSLKVEGKYVAFDEFDKILNKRKIDKSKKQSKRNVSVKKLFV